MRINSSNYRKTFNLVYLFILLALVFDLVIINLEGSLKNAFYLSPVAITIALFLWYRGAPVFLYDSDGEVLNFTVKEPRLLFLGTAFLTHIEFPKRKLTDYKIRTYPFKRILILSIKSRDGKIKKRKITISYLNKEELRDLKSSLKRVIIKKSTREKK